MTRQYMPVDEWAEGRLKDPAFKAAYDAAQDDFALPSAMIAARAKAGMTQAQVAAAMGTSEIKIARLESGHSIASTSMLERFAQATGTRLRISFEPEQSE